MKKASAATTMLGPAGVSHLSDPSRPSQTLAAPNIEAITAIISGFPENLLAVAAGIISKAVINKTPTIFIDIAITPAIKTMNKKLAKSGLNPSATAMS